MIPVGEDRIEVITAASKLRYTYTLDGELIGCENYSPASYSSFPDRGQSRRVPTSPWLLIFTDPLIAWGVGALGMMVLGTLEVRAKRLASATPPAVGRDDG